MAAFQGRNRTGYALYLEMTLNLELFEGWTGVSRERERDQECLAERASMSSGSAEGICWGLYHSVLKKRLF